MKIPTLIGLSFIIVLIALGGLFYYYRQDNKIISDLIISDLQIANITDNSATVIWQTNVPTVGNVSYSETESLNLNTSDNRDYAQSQPRLTHFVTIKNLKPNTKYFYKINNNSAGYPEKAQEFKTASIIPNPSDDLNFSFIKPLKGTILNTNLNPIDESLIILKIPGAENLATFSSTAGNFILPLKLVLSQNLDQIFSIPSNTPAELTIKKGNLQSVVKIIISEQTINLPPIPLGNNLDLVNFKTQPITKIIFNTPNQGGFDFNNDNKVNSLDLAILRELSTKQTIPNAQDQQRFDINSDGIIDQKDVDEFSKSLTGN